MQRCVETIKIMDGKPARLSLHQERFDTTRREFYKDEAPLSLAEVIDVPKEFSSGIVKCRIIYTTTIHDVTYNAYTRKEVHSLKLVRDDDIDYRYKYEDRSALDNLFSRKDECDDILIIKNGLVTDTSSSSIAFLRDGHWYTPQFPLLPSTSRQWYISQGIITPLAITSHMLPQFERARLISAMRDFEEKNDVTIKNIHS